MPSRKGRQQLLAPQRWAKGKLTTTTGRFPYKLPWLRISNYVCDGQREMLIQKVVHLETGEISTRTAARRQNLLYILDQNS